MHCTKCKHYYITWDPQFPKGCRIYGIKTQTMPSIKVLELTGQACLGYLEKDLKVSSSK